MKETAYLIIHGFNGSPKETRYLADYLRRKNLDIHTVLLSGHGGTKKELKNSSHTDWISSAERAVKSLLREYRRIVLIGFSMGGLISLHFAKMPKVDRIVLINTPIYFWNIKVIAKDIFTGIVSRDFDRIKYYKGAVMRSSLKSSIDFLKILLMTKRMIGVIEKPVLIIQCKNDESVRFKSAGYIKDKLGDSAVLQYYDGGCHQLFANSGAEIRDRACDRIFGFLGE